MNPNAQRLSQILNCDGPEGVCVDFSLLMARRLLRVLKWPNVALDDDDLDGTTRLDSAVQV